MENRAHFVLIGAAVIAFLAGLAFFVVWKLNSGTREDFAFYRIYFDGDVQGLNDGSPVFYRGIRVGRVSSVSIGNRDITQADGSKRQIEKIVVVIAITYGLDIRENSYALIERPLVAGQAYIQVVGGPDSDPPKAKKRFGDEPYPEIAQGTTFLQATVSSAQDVLAKISSTVDRINTLVSEDNVKALSQFAQNLASISSNIEQRNEQIGSTIAELPATLQQLRMTMAQVEGIAKSAEGILAELGPQDAATRARLAKQTPGELRLTLQSIRGAVDNLNRAADGLNKMVAENRAPFRQFSEGGLAEFTQTIRELRALVANLNVITTRIERDPTGFIFGGKQGYTPQ